MKTNGKHEVVAQIIRRGLVLAALLALALSGSSATRAQSTSPTAATNPAPAVIKAIPTSADAPPPRGSREGIKIHGHWTIEIRNPNGSLDKRVEFENAICPTQTITISLFGSPITSTFPGGALALSSVASGQAQIGPWGIVLGSSAALNATPAVPAGCIAPNTNSFTSYPNAILLLQNNAPASLLSSCTGGSCNPTLNPPSAATAANPVIALNGQFTAAAAGSISLVSTVNYVCSTVACPNYPFDSPAVLTGTQLTGTGGIPGPQSYTAGQNVSATVVISFQ
jgi:hypothetical protein